MCYLTNAALLVSTRYPKENPPHTLAPPTTSPSLKARQEPGTRLSQDEHHLVDWRTNPGPTLSPGLHDVFGTVDFGRPLASNPLYKFRSFRARSSRLLQSWSILLGEAPQTGHYRVLVKAAFGFWEMIPKRPSRLHWRIR